MKSLDYTFSDDDTAIPTPKIERQKQSLDAKAYRQKILDKRRVNGALSSSSGNIQLKLESLDVTKSPGFRREKQLDNQRKRDRDLEKKLSDEMKEHKSTFAQSTFNMANILMVSLTRIPLQLDLNCSHQHSIGRGYAWSPICIQKRWMGRGAMRHYWILLGHMENSKWILVLAHFHANMQCSHLMYDNVYLEKVLLSGERIKR